MKETASSLDVQCQAGWYLFDLAIFVFLVRLTQSLGDLKKNSTSENFVANEEQVDP